MSYKLFPKQKNASGDEVQTTVIRKEDNVLIPYDPANTDYIEYLEWVAAGNTPEAAD
jgi:hypothetical protein